MFYNKTRMPLSEHTNKILLDFFKILLNLLDLLDLLDFCFVLDYPINLLKHSSKPNPFSSNPYSHAIGLYTHNFFKTRIPLK